MQCTHTLPRNAFLGGVWGGAHGLSLCEEPHANPLAAAEGPRAFSAASPVSVMESMQSTSSCSDEALTHFATP